MKRAGIDPGSGQLAVVITEGETIPLSLVAAKTFEVGRLVPRKKPIQAKNGFLLTHKRELTADDVQGLATEVLTYLQHHVVERAVIEWIDHVRVRAGEGREGAAKAGAIGTALIRTMWIAAVLNEKLEAAGMRVVRVQRSTWAARVARVTSPKGRGRAEVGPAVTQHLLGWEEHDAQRFSRPEKGLEHERDAAGCAIWDALPPVQKKDRSAGTGAPRAKRRPNPPPKPRLPPPDLATMAVFQGENPEILRVLAKFRRRRPEPRALHTSEETKRKQILSRCTCKKPSQTSARLPPGRHRATCPLSTQAKEHS